ISSLSTSEIVEAPQLGLRLQELLDETGLDILAVYEGTDFLRAVISPRTGLADLPELEFQLLRDAQREGKAVKVRALPGLEGVIMLAAVSYGTTGTEENPPLVVAGGTLVEKPVAEKLQELRQLYQTHRQLVVEKDSIKASHLLLFLMATLLILLASSWVGLYLARRVTVPIQALAAGTRQIMGGDLGHRVAVDADDELGVLVDSFNQMTAELEQNRDLLEQSNRELMETSRQQSEEQALIAAVLQSVTAGVMSFDRDGTVFTCNGAARTMLHLKDQVLGLPASEVLSGLNRSKLRVLLSKLPEDEEKGLSKLHREQVNLVVGGEWKALEVTISPIRDADGENQGRVMVLEDLTDLIKAQKLAAWTEAARRIAHEIKNPLTPIRLAAERLLRRYQADDPKIGQALEDAVEIIVREVATLQGMVDEFSRYARMPYPHPQETDFGRLVHETLDLYRDIKPGIEVRGEVAPDARQLWVDAKQLKQAMINLLDNAVEATDPPGAIVVKADRVDGQVRLTISDTGRGIPDADKEKLFLPYFSTKGRGTGLGLAIVHRIVTDHHGRIRVEANHPKGTVFTVELPAA
ncbi:MAG: HAMP domain-containing protein, partial [Acidobacteria bacterium]|nr:HAMP domain-containing protein [Acidobacteriota bacterium]